MTSIRIKVPAISLLIAVGVACDGARDTAPPAPAAAAKLLPGTTWFWQLHGALDESRDAKVYDIDLADTSADTIARLRSKGHVVVCYFSAGTFEDFRNDTGGIPVEALGKALPDWPDERWFDVRHAAVRTLVETRLDVARDKSCDAVEPDNVDAYANDSGFSLTRGDQIDFDRFVARGAHDRGLGVGLKNATDLVPDLVADFDWSLTEQCAEYGECDAYAPFIEAGKAVLAAEYTPKTAAVCEMAGELGLSLVFFPLDLDGGADYCD